MNRESWSRVRGILEPASELEGDERRAFVERACGDDAELRREVEELLAADERPVELTPPDSARVERALEGEREEPTQLGSWRLERRIGTGGMGSVWAASRVEGGFQQRAAIKLIKRGMDSDEVLARFERERSVLAGLEHPWIARLYDGGSAADGRPYLVMELVDGVPFDRYCAQAGRTLDEKLALFARVCDAVDFAHRQRVLHRDLKPQNVLVTPDGTPKLLDFGIAKVLGVDGVDATRTRTAQRIFTPQYASPEQLRGDALTVRSDVFSLGVMLYEVLTGKRPFDADRNPESEAAPPSRTARMRALAGDLDTIALKALSVEPPRRYSSAAQLGADVRRFLEGSPVLARVDSWGYRARKFTRRNRVLVGATAVVILSLSIGWAFSWTQHRSAQRARVLADDRLERVVQMVGTMSRTLTSRLAGIPGIADRRVEFLREICAEMETLRQTAPEHLRLACELAWMRCELAEAMGKPNQSNAGNPAEGLALLDRALADLEPWLVTDGLDVFLAGAAAGILSARGEFHSDAKRYAEARADLTRALNIVRASRAAAVGLSTPGLWSRECTLLQFLSHVEQSDRQLARSAEYADEHLRVVETAGTLYPEMRQFRYSLGTALYSRAVTRVEAGEFELARADFEQSVAVLERLQSEEPNEGTYPRALAVCRYRLSDAYRLCGRTADASAAAKAAWDSFEAIARAEPDNIGTIDNILTYAYAAGSLAAENGELDLARRALERTLVALDERFVRHPEQRYLLMTRASAGAELAAVLARQGEIDAALALAASSIEGGLSVENDPGRGDEWNLGMGYAYLSQSECLVRAAEATERSASDRLARIEKLDDSLRRARGHMEAAERDGVLGADERTEFARLDGLAAQAAALRSSLPIE